jgi:hypothetical protein
MTLGGLLAGMSVLVLVLLVFRAAQAVVTERKAPRGVDPGHGDTLIDVNYASGGGGGGHSTTIRVPKDPQEYAKAFVPLNRAAKAPNKRKN